MAHLPSPSVPGRTPRPLWLIVLSAGLIVGITMGLRQVMGLYLPPLTRALGIGREPFSNAMALANLVWGLGAVIAGMLADRWGVGRVVVAGALSTMAGLYLMYSARAEFDLMLSGVLMGIGVAGTGISTLVGAVGRAAPPALRTRVIATLGMASGIGGFLAFPYTHVLMDVVGWAGSLLILMLTVAAVLPLAGPLRGQGNGPAGGLPRQSLMHAIKEASTHPSYLLVTAGFFVCGFHLAFYGVHLPAFVADAGLDGSVAVLSLTLVGLANLVGTYLAGRSGRFISKRRGLSLIYVARSFVFLGLLLLPITPATVIGLSTLLGLFWLSTVPLTSSLVATFFGTQ